MRPKKHKTTGSNDLTRLNQIINLKHELVLLAGKLDWLLTESLRVAHEAGALRSNDLKRVTVDTTVQPKAITFPTDAKLLHATIKGLNRLATAPDCGNPIVV